MQPSTPPAHITAIRGTAIALTLGVVGALVFSAACYFDECMTDDPLSWCFDEDCSEGVLCLEEAYEGRKIVKNWLAQPGEVTLCPYTGRKFEVTERSARVAYEGYLFVFACQGECIEDVLGDRAYYLDDLVEEAGGPATDPDPNWGGAIEDED